MADKVERVPRTLTFIQSAQLYDAIYSFKNYAREELGGQTLIAVVEAVDSWERQVHTDQRGCGMFAPKGRKGTDEGPRKSDQQIGTAALDACSATIWRRRA
jgi:hypothetical protein